MKEKNTKAHKIETIMERLELSRSQVYRLIDAGELVKIKVVPGGRAVRITDESLVAYMERRQAA